MRLKRTVAALSGVCLAAALLAGQARSQQAQGPAEEQVQPRFIWGILVNFAMSKLGSLVWDIFSKWLEVRVTGGLDSLTGSVSNAVVNRLTGSSGAKIGRKSAEGLSARAPAVVEGSPSAPLELKAGAENYQGASVALLVSQPGTGALEVRPLSRGFATGERFKLRVISTFSGEMTVENINPRNERRQIYPARPDQVLTIEQGKETFLPLGADEYFQFTKATGREQLVITLADPRGSGGQASTRPVFRQDAGYGSNFVQEVGPDRYPLISQSIELTHQAR